MATRAGRCNWLENLANFEVANSDDFHKLVDQHVLVTWVSHLIYYWADASPLLVASQAALPKHDKDRMKVDIKELDKISCVGRHDDKIVTHRVLPYFTIASAGHSDMRD